MSMIFVILNLFLAIKSDIFIPYLMIPPAVTQEESLNDPKESGDKSLPFSAFLNLHTCFL